MYHLKSTSKLQIYCLPIMSNTNNDPSELYIALLPSSVHNLCLFFIKFMLSISILFFEIPPNGTITRISTLKFEGEKSTSWDAPSNSFRTILSLTFRYTPNISEQRQCTWVHLSEVSERSLSKEWSEWGRGGGRGGFRRRGRGKNQFFTFNIY